MIGYDEEDGLFGEFIYGGTTPGFEGELWKHYYRNRDYAVSTYGRVWSCKSNIFLKPQKYDRYGHLGISMYYRGTVAYVHVHRMVAEMFIPNPDNLPVVRHLDGNAANNVVWNLALGTPRENWEDSVRHGTARIISEEALAMQRQPVIAISESDGSETKFASELNLRQGNINNCLRGERSQTGGYKFIRAF